MGSIKLVVALAFALVAGVVAVVRMMRWKAAAPFLVRTDARVADVSTADEGSGRSTRTVHRVVLIFTLKNGEQQAVDTTSSLEEWQKDALLPDRMVPIVYDSRDPDRFKILFEELKQRLGK
jgi:hypothetical protein